MGDKKLRYFAFTGIVLFIFSIIYFVVSIYISMSNAQKISQPLFDNFVQESNIQSFNSEQSVDQAKNYFQNIKTTVDKYSNIGAITLSLDSVPLFAYPTSSNFITLNAMNEPILTGSSPMLKTQSASVITANGQQMVVNAISYTLQPTDIYVAARVPFLVILAYTLILVIILIYNSLTKNTTTTEKKQMSSIYNFDATDYNECIANAENSIKTENIDKTLIINTTTEDEPLSEDIIEDFQNSQDTTTTSEITEEVIEENEIDNNELEEDTVEIPEIIPVVFREQENSLDDILQKKTEELNESKVELENNHEQDEQIEVEAQIDYDVTTEEVEIKDSTIPSVSDPMGLFSDVTGLGWASYLEPRLDSELIRATSSEQDLSLVFLQIKELNENIKAKKQIATILLQHFKFRDFVFEYTDDSFAGVLVNVDLDQCMVICENLYSDIKDYLLSENLSYEVGIGVSTRCLRIIPATRIITESQQALARAFEEEDLPIVAFRVNPEKYRDYVTNTQS